MSRLKNKVAIVTGASKGIGSRIARALAAEGAAVVVNYASSKADADKVVAEIAAAGGKALAVQADVSKRDDVVRLFEETKKAFGRLDVLVNNAGVYEFLPVHMVTEENFHKHFNLNVLGALMCIQEALKLFGPEGGSIINMSSIASTHAAKYASVYSGTKGALDAITRSLSKELGPKGIRINSINPGLIETEGSLSAGISEGAWKQSYVDGTALGRVGQTEDVAPTAVFLACPDSSWITGQCWRIDGGFP